MSDPISQVFELLQKKGRGDYIGERITQIEHMMGETPTTPLRGYFTFE